MDLSVNNYLAPGWTVSPHDTVNEYAATTATLAAGTFVKVSSAPNPAVTGSGATPYITVDRTLAGTPAYAYSPAWGVQHKVVAADSGNPVLGMTLYPVAETNAFGESYRRRPGFDQAEQQVYKSGDAVPIATRGIFRTRNWAGTTPSAGTGAYVSGGVLRVGNYQALKAQGSCVGQFLTAVDNLGYAKFKLEC